MKVTDDGNKNNNSNIDNYQELINFYIQSIVQEILRLKNSKTEKRTGIENFISQKNLTLLFHWY